MTWGFWGTYCDEAHALLSPNWHAPAGFDMAALQADLAAVTALGSGTAWRILRARSSVAKVLSRMTSRWRRLINCVEGQFWRTIRQ